MPLETPMTLKTSLEEDLQFKSMDATEELGRLFEFNIEALAEAMGDKRGIGRYGFVLPMDEAQASAALDCSGRAWFEFSGGFNRERVGDMPTELVPHFFHSLCDGARLNLHLKIEGDNDHHKVEACFKVVARALRQALRREGSELPSTKGML